MKKLALLLAIALTFSMLVSCSAPAEEAPASESETSQPAEETPAEDETPAEGGSISLLSWYNDQQLGPFLEAFEAETGTAVELQYTPPVQQYIDKFMVLVSSGQLTDLYYSAAENKEEIIEKGLAEDISALPVFERIDPNAISMYTFDGKNFAYAPDAWVGGIFYNKDIFEQAGISEAPTTWDELVVAMTAIKALGIEPIVSGSEQIHELPQAIYTSMVISQNPNADADINAGTTTFTEQYSEPFQIWYDEIYEPGLYSQISLGLNGDQAMDMFVTGQSAMISGGPWNIATFEEKNPDLNFGMFPIPDKDGNTILSGAVNVGLSISSSSENKDTAWDFLEFMSTDENILNWQKTTGNVLIVDGIDYEIDSVINDYKQAAVEGKFYLAQLVWNNSAAVYQEMRLGIQDVMTGADTIDNVAVRMDEKMAELS